MIFSAIIAMLPAGAGWGAVTIAGLSPAVSAAIIATGRSALWALGSMALTQRSLPRAQVMATMTETDRARIRSYGRNLTGGLRVFFEAKDGRLHQLVVFNHGEVDGLIRFWLDGEKVTTAGYGSSVDGGGRITGKRYHAVFFKRGVGAGGDYRGAFDPSVPDLARDWQDLHQAFPTLWTTAHRLQGQATFYAVFGDPSDEDFIKEFPKGPSTVLQVEYRGVRVQDMAGSYFYTENAGFCIRDLMMHRDGWGIPANRLDTPSWQRFVTRCNEPVPLATGGTEQRYRLCGYYSLDEPLKDVTARMLATCDGQIYETAEGKIGILGGAWSDPEVTITADDILHIEMQDGFDPFTDYNVLKGTFVSPAHAYQPTEVAEWRDEIALTTQPERVEQLDIEMCPSSGQMQRLMEIKAAKDRRAQVGTIRTNLVGMKARFPKGDGIHTIRIVADEFGINGVFEVTSHVFSVPDGFCEIGIASIANPYPWTAAKEKPLPPGIDDILLPSRDAPPITGISLTQEAVMVSGDVKGGKLVVTVANPGREDLHLRAQVARGNISAAGPWVDPQPAWVEMPGGRLRAETGILDDGVTYTVRLQWRRYSNWVKAGAVAVVSNPTPPAVPWNLSAMLTGSTVYLDWMNPPFNFARTQVWHNTTNNLATATLLKAVDGLAGQASNTTAPVSGTGSRFYWIRAVNESRVPSDFVGPVSVTL